MEFVSIGLLEKAIELFEERHKAGRAFVKERANGSSWISLAQLYDDSVKDMPSYHKMVETNKALRSFLEGLNDEEVCCITGLYLLGREVLEGERQPRSITKRSLIKAMDYCKGDEFLREYIGSKSIFGEVITNILPRCRKILS